MEKQITERSDLGVNIFSLVIIIAAIIFSLLSFRVSEFSDDLWKQLGIDQKAGTERIRESFQYGMLNYYGARNIRNIAAGDRTAIAKDLMEYTKQYVASEDFNKGYNSFREQKKPAQPAVPPTEEQIRKKYIDDTKQGISNLEKSMETAAPDMKKTLQETLDMFKKQLKDYEDPKSEMIKMSVQGNKTQYDFAMKEYQKQMQEWETKFPADTKAFVKNRLQQLLTATKDVDYGAALVEKNGRKYFVKPEYEHKSSNWKSAFRAGKETTETVRAFAQTWLGELK